jgi:DNA-binding NtrC family response regulator
MNYFGDSQISHNQTDSFKYKTIVILDEDTCFLRNLQDIFDNEGILSIGFTSYSSAIKSISKHSPDICLINYSKPDEKIIELIGWLKKNKPLIPIILLIDNDDSNQIIELRKLGVLKILEKNEKICDAVIPYVKDIFNKITP